MNRITCFATLSLLLLSLDLFAGNKTPVVAQQPSWTTPTTVNYKCNRLDNEAEDGYVDLHYEKQVSLQRQAVYIKKAVHILSEAGVQNQSEISVNYDPSYQSVAFHTVRIIRGDQVINKLDLSKIKTIQQEKDLDRFIYNGSLTAVLFLEDVRKDDIIEYSYTLKGFNPIFESRYAENFQTNFGVPVYNIYYKLIAPKEKALYIKNSLTNLQPIESTTATEKIYEWKTGEEAPVHTEPDIPSWYDAYSTVMVSEFGSWKEIADWALKLFPFSASVSGDVQKKVADIRTKYATPEARLLAALHFVQDDVRYLGVEMGTSSHKPHNPSQVLRQRFGDCKDKAYLLCTLLKALDIEAYPVLNNTDYKKTIFTWLPTPKAFDHTTVCVQLNGKTYWFDPTISYQRGPLQSISYPDYQAGLVIRSGTTSLTTIPLQDGGKIDTKEIFTVKSLHGSATLKVVTQYSGSFADNVRYNFQNNSLTETKKNYKDFYTGYFKDIAMDSLASADDEATGNITTTEYYTLKNFWAEEDGKTKVLFEPYLINSVLKKPKEETRKMPYALPYPIRYHEEIEVNLPEEWTTEESSATFNDAAFTFNYRHSQPASDQVLLEYNYENLSDHIQPEATAHFLKQLAKADESTAFELYSKIDDSLSAKGFSTTSNDGFTTAYVLLGVCVVGTYLYRKRKRASDYR